MFYVIFTSSFTTIIIITINNQASWLSYQWWWKTWQLGGSGGSRHISWTSRPWWTLACDSIYIIIVIVTKNHHHHHLQHHLHHHLHHLHHHHHLGSCSGRRGHCVSKSVTRLLKKLLGSLKIHSLFVQSHCHWFHFCHLNSVILVRFWLVFWYNCLWIPYLFGTYLG